MQCCQQDEVSQPEAYVWPMVKPPCFSFFFFASAETFPQKVNLFMERRYQLPSP